MHRLTASPIPLWATLWSSNVMANYVWMKFYTIKLKTVLYTSMPSVVPRVAVKASP